MRPFIFIILVGMLCIAGIPVCRADGGPLNNSNPDYDLMREVNRDLDKVEKASLNDQSSVDVHMQAVDQALDKIESSRNMPRLVPVEHVQSAAFNIVPKNNEIEFSSETYWAKFDEPKSFSQKGFLSGYNTKITHRISNNDLINMFGVQAQWANGKFKQPVDEGLSGIKDTTFDLRGVVGKDIYPVSNVRVTPYLGFGYRYLKDNAEGLSATFDAGTPESNTNDGFTSYSHYLYLPLGTDFVYQPDRHYSIETNLEYDYMFHGWQVDKLGAAQGGYFGVPFSTLVLDQKDGNGLRASLRLNLYFKYVTAFAEGFYRYWNIAQSNTKIDPINSPFSINELKNNTQEFGMRLGLEV